MRTVSVAIFVAVVATTLCGCGGGGGGGDDESTTTAAGTTPAGMAPAGKTTTPAGTTPAGETTTPEPTTQVAMGGYDVVAYFTLPLNATGVPGSPNFALDYGGATFRFATSSNLQAFRESPTSYAPQYGGFCAWGIAFEFPPDFPWLVNETLACLGPPCDPADGWTVHKGKLYCSIRRDMMTRWLNASDNVEAGDRRWAAWFGAPDAPPYNADCLFPEPLYTECSNRWKAAGCCDVGPKNYYCANSTLEFVL